MRLGIPSKIFREIVNIASSVGNVGRLRFRNGGAYVEVMDEERVSILSLKIPRDAFAHYEVSTSDVPLPLDVLSSFARACRGGTVELHHDSGRLTLKSGSLGLTAATPARSAVKFRVPSPDFPSKATLSMEDMCTALKAGSMVRDDVQIRLHPGGLHLTSRADDDVVDFHLRKEALYDHSGLDKESCGRYSLKRLQSVVRHIKGRRGRISLGPSSPLSLEFSLSDDSVNGKYLLAPCEE